MYHGIEQLKYGGDIEKLTYTTKRMKKIVRKNLKHGFGIKCKLSIIIILQFLISKTIKYIFFLGK